MAERSRSDSNPPVPGGLAERPANTEPPASIGPVSDGRNRRSAERIDVTWSVDCETEDTFLYAAIANISEIGIFVKTMDPLPVGTHLTLRFQPPRSVLDARDPLRGPSTEALVLGGKVQWVNHVRPLADNPNPGMGIRFIDLRLEDRETLVELIRTIAYLREEPAQPN
jgi:type IV pilus assembly protein PilZ